MRRKIAGLAAGLLVALGLAAGDAGTTSDPQDPLVVQTEYGALRGVEEDGVRAWRGIPYAAPPVDDRRWREPVEPAGWADVRDSSEYSDWCLQSERRESRAPSSSEDCLYLNVNRPASDAGDLPVMVWIHGGGFNDSSGGQPAFNSPALVERGVVLVSINYRLGRLGYFAHPAIEGGVANFGLLDQVAALEWVEANIEAFGGDRDNVTIFGESAGGVSVNMLMSSPRADGLFHRAISQSGLGRQKALTMSAAQAGGQGIFPDLDADALRDLDPRAALTSQLGLFAGELPIVDDALPRGVKETFAAGDQAEVPYLTGTTDLEFPDFTVARLGTPPDAVREALLGGLRGDALAAYGSERELALHLVSDALFTEPARLLASSQARLAPTYFYRFAIAPPSVVQTVGGATHATEVPYVFDTARPEQTGLAETPALADTMADYWVAFATAGDPNHADAPAWPVFDDGGLLEFTNDGPVSVTDDPWQQRLDVVRKASEARS